MNYVTLREPATWIKANNDYRMYYITNYDLSGWQKMFFLLVDDHTRLTTAGTINTFVSNLLSRGKWGPEHNIVPYLVLRVVTNIAG